MVPEARYHHGDLRRALLDAAEAMVAREGVAQVSLRAVAREAGVSHAAPYHHFPDRESVLAAVAARGFRGLEQALRTGAGSRPDADPLASLAGSGIAYVEFARANPQIYRLMFGGLLSDRARFPELQAAANSTFAVLEQLIGEARGASPRPDPVALTAWSTVHGLASLLIEGLLATESALISVDEITREVIKVLGLGLRSSTACPQRTS